ncbi:MAG TPA: hypothetical protein VML75_05455 [Kofleriaceae bacterium]|nr:hypothetical protein [Kofleriaceae bacterium]
MSDRDIRERDILVAPNEYAYVQDLTKGDIVLYVGPTKISLSNTERMIVLRDGCFVPVRGDEAGVGVHRFVRASSSQYVILENPTTDAAARPSKGANSAVSLELGRKIVVPGPAAFPLWPGQRAEVIDGHELRDNEYLVVRVYDDRAGDAPIGSEIIVRGSDASFYVPPSGREVVPGPGGRYEREAWRMEKTNGLHVRVTAPFEATEGALLPPGRYTPGQDLFLRGREGYFVPTESLEVVGAAAPVALAEREAIYVRQRDTGHIATVKGPQAYLVDPTREELVARRLAAGVDALYRVERAELHRAPTIYVPPSTAVMVTALSRREVVIGPQTRILDYDEELEVLTLSTGRPKRDDELLPTCFLQIQGNRVSDQVTVKTADHVELEVAVSYRVSFVGDAERWFNVKNYVGLMCEHLGSILRAAARAVSIDQFHARSTDILRSAVLGPRIEGSEREGRHFAENGMWVYDVEVLDVEILDEEVGMLLCEAQRVAITSDISRRQEELRLGDERLKEQVSQAIYQARVATLERATEVEEVSRLLEMTKAETRVALDKADVVGRALAQAEATAIADKARLATAAEEVTLEARTLEARAAAFRAQMQALQPELIATLQSVAGKQLAGELSRNLSPLAILGGESIADVVGRLLDRLPLKPAGANGHASDIRTLLGMEAAGADE